MKAHVFNAANTLNLEKVTYHWLFGIPNSRGVTINIFAYDACDEPVLLSAPVQGRVGILVNAADFDFVRFLCCHVFILQQRQR